MEKTRGGAASACLFFDPVTPAPRALASPGPRAGPWPAPRPPASRRCSRSAGRSSRWGRSPGGPAWRRTLKKDYEEAARKQAERERQEKEEEKEERRRKAEERARRIEEEKLNRGKKKKAEKKHEEEEKIPGIVKEYSRVGIRQYARGRAYDPYRYSEDGPTCYPGEAPIFGRKPDKSAPVEEEPAQETPALEAVPQVDASAADTPAAGDGETKE